MSYGCGLNGRPVGINVFLLQLVWTSKTSWSRVSENLHSLFFLCCASFVIAFFLLHFFHFSIDECYFNLCVCVCVCAISFDVISIVLSLQLQVFISTMNRRMWQEYHELATGAPALLVCPPVSLWLSLCLCLPVSAPLALSVSVSLNFLCPFCVCLCLSLFVFACVCVCL